MHGFPEIDGVQRLDDIAALFEHLAALYQHRTLGIDHHIRGMSLKQLRCEPKAGFAGAGRADPAEIEVAGIGGIFGASIHGKPFRGGQQHIVFKLGIKERFDVLFRSP